ncbi:MAG: hypothetical protein R3F34_19325 [Planctomycetota bacterium]
MNAHILACGLAGAAALALLATSQFEPAGASPPAPLPSIGPVPISSLPFSITEPGTYFVTGDLVAPDGEYGIVVAAAGVTIDLGGFTLRGGDDSQIGVLALSAENIVVRNGRLQSWEAAGILVGVNGRIEHLSILACDDAIFGARSTTVEDVHVAFATGRCIELAYGSIVRDSTIQASSGAELGLSLDESCTAENVVVSGSMIGISCGRACRVSSCSVSNCDDVGLVGESFAELLGVRALECGRGLAVTDDCVVRDCMVTGALGHAVEVLGERNRVEGNSVTGCAGGIRVAGKHNLVVRNMVFDSGLDYAVAPLNPTGPVLRDFSTIQSQHPQANFATPFF